MTQPTMFDAADNPIAHANDPATSHAAADAVTRSGRRDRHCQLVLDLVRRHPGRTAVELWSMADLDAREELAELQEVRRRLTDLAATGRVVRGPSRNCGVRGSLMVTWWIV